MAYRRNKTTQQFEPEFDPETVAAALIHAKGMVSDAAKKLGCHKTTVYHYIKIHPIVKAAMEEARENQGDVAEKALFRNVSRGDQRAIEFYLKTQHRARGYVERHEFALSEETPITVNIMTVPERNSADQPDSTSKEDE